MRHLLFVGLVLSLLAGTAQAAVQREASATHTCGSCSPLTFSHTVGSGSDRRLDIWVTWMNTTPISITAVSYNGVAATRIGGHSGSCAFGPCGVDLWRLIAPTTGAHTVSVSSSLPAWLTVGTASYTGAHQTIPEGTLHVTNGTNSSMSLTVSSAAGDLVAGSVIADAVGGSFSPTGGGSSFFGTTDPDGFTQSAGSDMVGTPSTAYGWDYGVSTNFVIAAIAIKPATAGAPSTYDDIVHVQSRQTVAGAVSSINLAYTSNVTAGNGLIIFVDGDGSIDVSTVAGNGNTYVQALACPTSAVSGGDDRDWIYYVRNALAGATTVTVTFTGATATYAGLAIHEYSGLALDTTILDKTACNEQVDPGTGTNAVSAGPVTTDTEKELVFTGGIGFNAGGAALVPGTGFTQRQQLYPEERTADKIQTVAGSVAGTWTAGNGTMDTQVVLATFRPKLLSGPVVGTSDLLLWNDNSTNEDFFRLEWKHATLPIYTLLATLGTNTQSHTNPFTTEVDRCYRIRAENTGGFSTYSNELCSATTAAGPIVPPLPAPFLAGGLADD